MSETAQRRTPRLRHWAVIRFCAYQYQHHRFPVLVERWHRAEEAGFDVVWNVDAVTEPDQFFEVTRDRCTGFDEACVEVGRDPKTIRHSLVCFAPLTPWESEAYFTDMVGRYGGVGSDEFVLYWPQSWRTAPHEDVVFEEVCGE